MDEDAPIVSCEFHLGNALFYPIGVDKYRVHTRRYKWYLSHYDFIDAPEIHFVKESQVLNLVSIRYRSIDGN